MIEVDGNMSEGGGQILRIATSLSAILKLAINVYDIRGGRKKPGLKAQHLHGLQLLREMTEGELEGDHLNSTRITFKPGQLLSKRYEVAIGTAGAVTLLMQSCLPCALFSPQNSHFVFHGGTNVDFSPPIDFHLQVLLPALAKFGVHVDDCELEKRGYFPKGGGKFCFSTRPIERLHAAEFVEFGEVVKLTGRSFVSGVLPVKMAREMAEHARRMLRERGLECDIDIEIVREERGVGNGSGIFLLLHTSTGCMISGSALGRRGLQLDEVSRMAVDEIMEQIDARPCVDENLQDQLIIFMGLAEGRSCMRTIPPTEHTRTAIKLVEYLIKAKFTVTENGDGSCLISCQGIGHKNQFL